MGRYISVRCINEEFQWYKHVHVYYTRCVYKRFMREQVENIRKKKKKRQRGNLLAKQEVT